MLLCSRIPSYTLIHPTSFSTKVSTDKQDTLPIPVTIDTFNKSVELLEFIQTYSSRVSRSTDNMVCICWNSFTNSSININFTLEVLEVHAAAKADIEALFTHTVTDETFKCKVHALILNLLYSTSTYVTNTGKISEKLLESYIANINHARRLACAQQVKFLLGFCIVEEIKRNHETVNLEYLLSDYTPSINPITNTAKWFNFFTKLAELSETFRYIAHWEHFIRIQNERCLDIPLNKTFLPYLHSNPMLPLPIIEVQKLFGFASETTLTLPLPSCYFEYQFRLLYNDFLAHIKADNESVKVLRHCLALSINPTPKSDEYTLQLAYMDHNQLNDALIKARILTQKQTLAICDMFTLGLDSRLKASTTSHNQKLVESFTLNHLKDLQANTSSIFNVTLGLQFFRILFMKKNSTLEACTGQLSLLFSQPTTIHATTNKTVHPTDFPEHFSDPINSRIFLEFANTIKTYISTHSSMQIKTLPQKADDQPHSTLKPPKETSVVDTPSQPQTSSLLSIPPLSSNEERVTNPQSTPYKINIKQPLAPSHCDREPFELRPIPSIDDSLDQLFSQTNYLSASFNELLGSTNETPISLLDEAMTLETRSLIELATMQSNNESKPLTSDQQNLIPLSTTSPLNSPFLKDDKSSSTLNDIWYSAEQATNDYFSSNTLKPSPTKRYRTY